MSNTTLSRKERTEYNTLRRLDLAKQLNEIFIAKARLELQLIASKHINNANFNLKKIRVNLNQLIADSIYEYRQKNNKPQERTMTEAGIMIWNREFGTRLQTIMKLRDETIKALLEKPLTLEPVKQMPCKDCHNLTKIGDKRE